MIDVIAIGELLIDFLPAGTSRQQLPLFEQNPGGAPANVLAGLSRLGRSTAFIGKVGDDPFGHSLKASLEQAGVATTGLVMTRQAGTLLAFVHLDSTGDRSFTFVGHPAADLQLATDEVAYQLIDDCRVFCFGSISLSAEPARQATLTAIQYAREHGALVSFDPNIRLPFWPSPEEAKTAILQAMHLADILKVSEEELTALTGITDIAEGADALRRQYDLKLVLVTRGARGAYAANGRVEADRPAFAVKTIDTTGAGDAFTAALIDRLLALGQAPDTLTADQLGHCLTYANAAGSLTTTRKGAMAALPTLAEITSCLAQTPTLG